MWQTIGQMIGKIAKVIGPYVKVAAIAIITHVLNDLNNRKNPASAK